MLPCVIQAVSIAPFRFVLWRLAQGKRKRHGSAGRLVKADAGRAAIQLGQPWLSLEGSLPLACPSRPSRAGRPSEVAVGDERRP